MLSALLLVTPAACIITPTQEPVADSAESATRALLEMCARGDWDRLESHIGFSPGDSLRNSYGGLTILQIGQGYPHRLCPSTVVPFQIRTRNGELRCREMWFRQARSSGKWFFDGGL